MLSPHGGTLVNRLVPEGNHPHLNEEAAEMPSISVTEEFRKDMECVAYGIFSPLVGPLNGDDYAAVLEKGRLTRGHAWTFPIVLDVPEETASRIKVGDDVALTLEGEAFSILHVEDKYSLDRKAHAQIAGFQTRNAPHVGHEYVQKTALAFTDGLFINPLIGKKKAGDFTDEVIIDTYTTLFDNYYLRNTATLVTLEMEMRYAGPREAIFHAICRKNYGCTHFIVGRDHAGVGNYYGPYEAQEKFSEFPDLGVTPLFFRSFFYCKKCGGVQNDKVCPHGPEEHLNFKGREMRSMLMKGERPSELLMRPEVVDAILRYTEPFVK